MIEVRDVRKVYGKKGNVFTALDGVSFEVPTGATVAIIGKSGSGKSTLMHIMGGLDHTTEGDVVIDGNALGGMKRKQLDRFRAQDLGFVFQSFFVEGNQTCYQNVSMPLEINRTSYHSRRAKVEAALEKVELLDKIDGKARNLSGGQKQRLAIARAIVNEPRYIMADEPTGNLDSVTGEKIVELLFGLSKSLGSTLIVITHDDELAVRCDMQVHIKDGKITDIKGSKSAKQVPAKTAKRKRVQA